MAAVDDVLKYIATNEVRWVDLHFLDLKGILHRVSVSSRELEEESFSKGIAAAKLEEVFGKSEQGDLILLPDPDTLARLPWETSTVRLMCDIMVALKNERYLKDPRYVAERIDTNLHALGIREARLSSEVEFYIFDTATTDRTTKGRGAGTLVDSREAHWSPSPLASVEKGSFLSQPFDSIYPARIQISETLEENFGFPVQFHHHGRGQSAQQSIRIMEFPTKTASDAFLTAKFVTRNLASAVNALATFMPYPVYGEPGSGLTIHQSLWKSADNNIFYDGSDKYAQVSQAGRYYIGGILEHIAALMLFTAPTSNSYKRLAVDPPTIGWSKNREHAAVQVPHLLKNNKEERRIAFTAADPAVNPYVAYGVVVAAGLDGIKNKTDPGDPLEDEGKKKKKFAVLPKSLYEAVAALESDTKFLKGVIPADFLGDYVDLKLKEHHSSMRAITNWEMEKYINV